MQSLISATGLTGPAFAETRDVLPERPAWLAGQELIAWLAQGNEFIKRGFSSWL